MYSNTSELKQKLVSKVFRRSWIAALASSSTSKVQTLNAQNFFANCKSSQINGLFGSLEKEERGGEGSRGEESRGEWFPSTLFGCF